MHRILSTDHTTYRLVRLDDQSYFGTTVTRTTSSTLHLLLANLLA